MSSLIADEVFIGCEDMAIRFFPIGSTFDAVIINLHTADDPSTPVTDATITATLQDADGNDVAGAIDVNMSHKGSGEYRGSITPGVDLTEHARYTLIMTSTNFSAEWRDT